MKSIRLLPLVVLAALALLLLKGIGLWTGGGYALTGIDAVQAQTTEVEPLTVDPDAAGQEPVNPAQAQTDARTGISDAAAAAADRASESLFSHAGPAPINSSQLDAVPFEQNKAGVKVPLTSVDGVTDTEKAVLERLSERRAELDAIENDLKSREAVIAAAEKRLDERVNALKSLQVQIDALVEQKKAADEEQFKGLVSMYENMKAKDAASIFDQLSSDVLYRVAAAMNPRKMAPVLAAMDPARAQELTTLLAAQQTEPSLDAGAVEDLSQLPQIVGQ